MTGYVISCKHDCLWYNTGSLIVIINLESPAPKNSVVTVWYSCDYVVQ